MPRVSRAPSAHLRGLLAQMEGVGDGNVVIEGGDETGRRTIAHALHDRLLTWSQISQTKYGIRRHPQIASRDWMSVRVVSGVS